MRLYKNAWASVRFIDCLLFILTKLVEIMLIDKLKITKANSIARKLKRLSNNFMFQTFVTNTQNKNEKKT